LNKLLLPLIEKLSAPGAERKDIRIKYIMQIPSPIPQFAFFCNLPQYINETYRRFLENKMREYFDFSGVPISLFFRSKDKNED
jgi:GTP-binding protein